MKTIEMAKLDDVFLENEPLVFLRKATVSEIAAAREETLSRLRLYSNVRKCKDMWIMTWLDWDCEEQLSEIARVLASRDECVDTLFRELHQSYKWGIPPISLDEHIV